MDVAPASSSCHYCGKRGPGFKCQRCRIACYCGRAHQKLHWKTHKMFCDASRRESKGGDDVGANREPVKLGPPSASKLRVERRAEEEARKKTQRAGTQYVARGMLDRAVKSFEEATTDAREDLRLLRNARSAEEISVEYHTAVGRSAYEVDVQMRTYLRELLDAMGTREDRAMAVFSAWTAESQAARTLVGAMVAGESPTEDYRTTMTAYVENGEIARKILAEEVLRWTRESIAAGIVPPEAGATVFEQLAGDDPNAAPEARARHEKLVAETLGRELSMSESATIGGRSFLAARGGPDDAAGPASRATRAPFVFVGGENEAIKDDAVGNRALDDLKFSDAEADAGPSGSADADWEPSGDDPPKMRAVQDVAPDEVVEATFPPNASETERREMRMREALRLLAEVESIYDHKAAAGDSDALVPAAEVRETTRRIATAPSQFLDSRKVLTYAATAVGVALVFGAGAYAYRADFLGVRDLSTTMRAKFAEMKSTLDGAEEKLADAVADVAKNREEIGDVMKSTVEVAKKIDAVQNLTASQAAIARDLDELTAKLNAGACTADQIVDNANACAVTTLETVGTLHAKLAETAAASAFAASSTEIAQTCRTLLAEYGATGTIKRADAEWLAKNLMSDDVRDFLRTVASGSKRLTDLSRAVEGELSRVEGSIEDVVKKLSGADASLVALADDVAEGLKNVENSKALLESAKKATSDYVASAGDVTCVRAFVETVKRWMPGHDNLADYLAMKLVALDAAERVARNMKKTRDYARAVGGGVGALSYVSNVLFGLLALNDAFRSSSSLGSVMQLVSTVLRWPGATLYRWGEKMVNYSRVALAREDEVDRAVRTANAIRAGEKVTDLDYEAMKRSHGAISAHVGRNSAYKRVPVMLCGVPLLGLGAVLRGCATVTRVATGPLRAGAHVGNLSSAFVAVGSRFSAAVHASRAAVVASGSTYVPSGLVGAITFIGSPTTTLRELVVFLKDAIWPIATAVCEFVASHVWGIATGTATFLVGGAICAHLLRETGFAQKVSAAFRGFRYFSFGLRTSWDVATAASSSYTLVSLGMMAGPLVGPPMSCAFVAMQLAQTGWSIYKRWTRLKTKSGQSSTVGSRRGDEDDDDEFMPTVEDVVAPREVFDFGVDDVGDPISTENVAGALLGLKEAVRTLMATVVRRMTDERETILAEAILKAMAEASVSEEREDEDASVLRSVRNDLALIPASNPFPTTTISVML